MINSRQLEANRSVFRKHEGSGTVQCAGDLADRGSYIKARVGDLIIINVGRQVHRREV